MGRMAFAVAETVRDARQQVLDKFRENEDHSADSLTDAINDLAAEPTKVLDIPGGYYFFA